jgi:hypothetical protein
VRAAYREKTKAKERGAHAYYYVCSRRRASRIASSGIFDGSLKSGRAVGPLALARVDRFAWAWLGTGELDKEAQAAAEVARRPRCPSATRSASCFLLVRDSLMLVGPLS